MSDEGTSNIGDRKRELLRLEQWEALCEKYEKRGQINTDECNFSDVNYKMFIKPPLKAKLKKRGNKTKKDRRKINSSNTKAVKVGSRISNKVNITKETSDNTISATDTDAFINIDVSQFIDEDSNDIPCNLSYKNNRREKENHTSYEIESVDSGVEVSDVVEQSYETAPSPLNTFVNIDVSEIIDEDNPTLSQTCNFNKQTDCTEVQSAVNDRLNKLIFFIEHDLKSNLKIMLNNRSVAKLLESDDYNHWHKCTKKEMTRLERYVSRKDLIEYMRFCYDGEIPEFINVHLIGDVIVRKMNSNINKLFLKREFSRNDKDKYLKYQKRIFKEWQRLYEVIPIEFLLLYGTSVLNSIEKLKERTFSPIKE